VVPIGVRTGDHRSASLGPSKVKSELQLVGLKIMTFSVMAPGGPDRGSNRGPPHCKSRTLLLDPIGPARFYIATDRPFSICLASFIGDRTRNKVLSGRKPRQINYKIRRFGDELHVHHQGDVTSSISITRSLWWWRWSWSPKRWILWSIQRGRLSEKTLSWPLNATWLR